MSASRRSAIPPFLAMETLARADAREAAGHDVVRMNLGEPGAPPPERVLAAARAVLDGRSLGYGPALGDPRLRARIAASYGERHGFDLDPARVVVTTGSSGGFVLAVLAAFDAGDRVALTVPGYPAWRNTLDALGIEVAPVRLREADGWVPTGEGLALAAGDAPLAGAIVLNPSNPTGGLLDAAALGSFAFACRGLGARLVSDEIYAPLTWTGPEVTALTHDDDAIVLGGFSKYHGMTGWRVGWLVLPPDLLPAVERLAQNLFICAPVVSQAAALAAFDATAELDEVRASYAANRNLVRAALPGLGLGRVMPMDGAFYAYADCSALNALAGVADSAALCERLLDEAGVALTPGLDFDREDGGDWLRLSYAGSRASVASGLDRLAAWARRGGDSPRS